MYYLMLKLNKCYVMLCKKGEGVFVLHEKYTGFHQLNFRKWNYLFSVFYQPPAATLVAYSFCTNIKMWGFSGPSHQQQQQPQPTTTTKTTNRKMFKILETAKKIDSLAAFSFGECFFKKGSFSTFRVSPSVRPSVRDS